MINKNNKNVSINMNTMIHITLINLYKQTYIISSTMTNNRLFNNHKILNIIKYLCQIKLFMILYNK